MEIFGIPLMTYPSINATCNAISTVFICLGWWFIRRGQQKAHIVMMVSALITSTVFLASYLIYHINKPGPVRFEEVGMLRWTYMTILATHIILAFTVIPLVTMTVVPALRRRFDRHRRIGRWTMPIWLYVSFTGVLVYLMLYQWYPPAVLTGVPTPLPTPTP